MFRLHEIKKRYTEDTLYQYIVSFLAHLLGTFLL
nr:MAG TPA: hypothetical protein [Caudoviricetes sp.]